jgi:putative toxin-antitoxin system antitoxin component (TIGR02293 family)
MVSRATPRGEGRLPASAPAAVKASPSGSEEAELYAIAANLLGGLEVPAAEIRGPHDIHEALLKGLPGSALTTLLGSFRVLPRSGKRLEVAMGVSLRTIQRKKGDTAKRLSVEQAGRTWIFAEMLARATKILGSQEAAERWLERPAIGLDRKSPIDLLATPAGTRMVDDYLTRIEYGVYT